MTVLIDNDILLKSACYRLLAELVTANCGTDHVGYLTAARFVISNRIRRATLRGDAAVIETELLSFLANHVAIETTPEEQALAAALEASAQRMPVSLDTGESQLLAVMALRTLPSMFTGDKRAIIAIERLIDVVEEIVVVSGKVICLEQLVNRALSQGDAIAIRIAVCGEPDIDRTLNICFSCHNSEQPTASIFEGLDSYISDLRRQAPRTLAT
ncbi:MAG TPA: hypothetical protein VGG72_20835 [Bryobacteraceae bacterium]|jgi:hypothetical protein